MGVVLLESFVAIMAMVAACVLEPGIFLSINSPIGVVGQEAAQAIETINSWVSSVSLEEMNQLAEDVGETVFICRELVALRP